MPERYPHGGLLTTLGFWMVLTYRVRDSDSRKRSILYSSELKRLRMHLINHFGKLCSFLSRILLAPHSIIPGKSSVSRDRHAFRRQRLNLVRESIINETRDWSEIKPANQFIHLTDSNYYPSKNVNFVFWIFTPLGFFPSSSSSSLSSLLLSPVAFTRPWIWIRTPVKPTKF